MTKNNTGRKWTVIKDELKIDGGGCYCFFPFNKLDKNKKGVFKIGMTSSFNSRADNYNTYFPLGVYMCAFLINPPIPAATRSNVKNKVKITKDSHYKVVERFIFDRVKHHGAVQIYSTARVLNANVEKEGQTEWFYCSQTMIHDAFKEAHKKYGGELKLFYLQGIDPVTGAEFDITKDTETKKPNYTGQIVYHTGKTN